MRKIFVAASAIIAVGACSEPNSPYPLPAPDIPAAGNVQISSVTGGLSVGSLPRMSRPDYMIGVFRLSDNGSYDQVQDVDIDTREFQSDEFFMTTVPTEYVDDPGILQQVVEFNMREICRTPEGVHYLYDPNGIASNFLKVPSVEIALNGCAPNFS